MVVALVAAGCGSGSKSSGKAASGGGSPGTTAAATQAGKVGPGCTQVVKIGTTYSTDEGQVMIQLGNSAFGKEVSSPNAAELAKAFYQHLSDWVNAHGGLDGCKMQWVYYNFQFGDPGGESANSQNECVTFAEDNHVFAELNQDNENQTLISCLASHKTVLLYQGGLQYRPTPADFTKYRGYLYQPDEVNPYRLGAEIDMLNKAGYFGANPASAKVGILLADDGSGTNQYLVNKLWKPALAALGIKSPVVFTFFQCTTVANCTTTTNSFQSAILKFRQAGVDHVIFTPDGGDGVFFFSQVAHSQGFHPRYALNTAAAAALWNTEPSDQQPNAMDVSWNTVDLYPNFSALAALGTTNTTQATCNSILKPFYPGYYQVYYGVCDEVLFLYTALKGAPAITPQALLAGVDKMGGSFPLADGYGNAFFGPPNHYDGATTARVLSWDQAKQQWNFVPSVPATQFPTNP